MRLVIGNTNLGMIVDRDSNATDNLMSLVISRPPKLKDPPVPIDCEEAVDDTEREIARVATATAAALSTEAESSAAHIHINTRDR